MVNFFMTMRGSWGRVSQSAVLRFFVTGAICWGLTCLQGVAHSFRSFSMVVHLTNWVVGHSHLAFVVSYSFWGFALIYLLLPQLVGRPLQGRQLIAWHYWLTTGGMTIFMVSLWVAGVIQGTNWASNSVPFLETVMAMKPYFGARLLGGAMAGLGIVCFVIVVLRTAVGVAPSPALAVGSLGRA